MEKKPRGSVRQGKGSVFGGNVGKTAFVAFPCNQQPSELLRDVRDIPASKMN